MNTRSKPQSRANVLRRVIPRSVRRKIPKPLRRFLLRIYPAVPPLSSRYDRATQSRIVVLPLPVARGPLRWRQKQFALTLRVPGTFWVPRVLGEKGLGEYEPEALSVFLALLENAGRRAVFFDVGSNVGPFCLVAAAVSSARVVAFEPAPATADALRAIKIDNDLKISVEQMALGDHDGESQLYLSMQSDASNSLQADFREWQETVAVRVETLDGYSARTGLVPSLLKIDTEATEPSVLRGAHRLLDGPKPPIICEVLPGRTEHDLEKIFGSYGYAFYRIGENGTLERRSQIEGDQEYRFRDWLFSAQPLTDRFARAVRRWNEALTP